MGALFPLAHLMMHGVVLAGHGDALANGLHIMTPHDWAQEVWSLAAMGLQLQELYISTKFMLPWSWDELALALHFARENWEVLQDAHWILPAGCDMAQTKKKFRPYGLAAYKSNASDSTGRGKGFLFLRNPRDKAQAVPDFTLAVALELPAAEVRSSLQLQVVRRITKDEKEIDLDCASFGRYAAADESGRCMILATAPLLFKMQPGEVLVLRVELL